MDFSYQYERLRFRTAGGGSGKGTPPATASAVPARGRTLALRLPVEYNKAVLPARNCGAGAIAGGASRGFQCPVEPLKTRGR